MAETFPNPYEGDPYGDDPFSTQPVPELSHALDTLHAVGRYRTDELAELLASQMGVGSNVDGVLRRVAELRPDWLARLEKDDRALLLEARLYDGEKVRERRRRRIRAELDAEDRIEERAEAPALVSLAELLDEPDEPVQYRIDKVWPVDGRVVLAARNKSGKTTLVGNVIRCLVDGEDFLDRYTVDPVDRVVLMDDEMSRTMVRRWLAQQDITATERVQVVPLRGALSSFDILDPAVRRQWAQAIQGADVLVFDCLRPALDSLGLDENLDAGRFLVALDELCREAGIRELLLVHHMGHSNERSRGSSRIDDWPDVKWKLVREDSDEERSPSYFSAYGRDVDEHESRLTYDPFNRHLSIDGSGTSRKQAKAEGVAAKVIEYLREWPGCTGRQMEGQVEGKPGVGGSAVDIRKAVKWLLSEGAVKVEKGQRGAKLHYLIDHDPDLL